MTRKDMLQRLRELGGKTPYNAVLIAKEKYSKKGRKRIWNDCGGVCSGHYPNKNNCSCCVLFWGVPGCVSVAGSNCPLSDKGVAASCFKLGFSKVTTGLVLGELDRFNDGCNSLVRHCNNWLRRKANRK